MNKSQILRNLFSAINDARYDFEDPKYRPVFDLIDRAHDCIDDAQVILVKIEGVL